MAKKTEIVVVKDEESGKHITITEESKKIAIENSERTKQARRKKAEGFLEEAILLKENRDNKLWKHLGYKSFKEYVELEQEVSERYAYMHISIIEKLPPHLLKLVSVLPLTIHKLTQLLPLPEKALSKVDEDKLKEWAEMPLKDFNEEMRKTKARYAKVRRDKIRIEEKNLTLEAEIEELLKEAEELKKENQLLKTTDKNEKILKLQQSRDNLLQKLKELQATEDERQSKELKEELALAAIENAQNSVTTAFLDLRKLEVSPAILPQLYSFYKWCRKILDTQITVLTDRFEPERGPLDLEFYTKEVKDFEKRRKIKFQSDLEKEKETE